MVDLGISKQRPPTPHHTHTQKNLIKIMDECLVIITIFKLFFKIDTRVIHKKNKNKKTESIITLNFFSMCHRFGVSENWGEMEGKLKFGFAQGRVQIFVFCMPIGR